jgi:hypothetical protein
VIQIEWQGGNLSQEWHFEPVGDGPHVDLNRVATAMYRLTFRHSGQALAVRDGSPLEGANIEQAAYSAGDDRFHWFVTRVQEASQLINRRTGLCLALQEESTTSSLVQARCAADALQLFTFASIGDGHQVVYASTGRMLQVDSASTLEGAPVIQVDGGWSDQSMIQLTPLLAGEPHRLTFSHVTNDGPCGDYYWYDIAQPTGEPLRSPEDSFVQLIFAGGKDSPAGNDENPFIAQRVDGNRVAIDPSGFMNGGSYSRSGGCLATDVLYDAETALLGACCVRYDGSYGQFESSGWDANTFVCAKGSGDDGLAGDAPTQPDPTPAGDAGPALAEVDPPDPGTSPALPDEQGDLEGSGSKAALQGNSHAAGEPASIEDERSFDAASSGCSVPRAHAQRAPWALGLLLLAASTRRRSRARGRPRAER